MDVPTSLSQAAKVDLFDGRQRAVQYSFVSLLLAGAPGVRWRYRVFRQL